MSSSTLGVGADDLVTGEAVALELPAAGIAIRALSGALDLLIAFVAFLRYESRRHDPFIDLRFFRSVPFAGATLTAICAFSAWGAFLFMMSLEGNAKQKAELVRRVLAM